MAPLAQEHVIGPLVPEDEPEVERLLDVEFAGRVQARLGQVHDVLALPGFVARHEGRAVGAATYRVDGARAELAALAVAADHRSTGLGGALVEAVVTAARQAGAGELWLLTTNDNLQALGFYQRRGFVLAELHPGGVTRARTLKPDIPDIGEAGIPIRDELVLVRSL